MAFDITDPDDPEAPVFDLENGYFDVTNKAFAKPQIVDLSSLGFKHADTRLGNQIPQLVAVRLFKCVTRGIIAQVLTRAKMV